MRWYRHRRHDRACEPCHIAPQADAGGNKTITLPTSSVSATGSGTDADGSIVSQQWTAV
jgi:hypothetical protein